VALQIGLGGQPAEHQRVGVDEGAILSLLFREAGCGSCETRARHPIHLCTLVVLGHVMNVPYRVELSQVERDQLMALLSGGKHAARRLKRAQILLAADAGANDERS